MKEIELSVVLPCLNEEASIGACIKKIGKAFSDNHIKGEIIVADNNSTDRSVEIAESLGAKVVHQKLRGYGNTYLKGLSEAKGRYILMADSDNTYDFLEIPLFLEPLRQGKADFVIGSRLKGKIMPGAMPKLHQYIGSPLLTGMLNLFFRTNVSDAHCGMRAFSADAYRKLNLKCGGMEFASEMIIKAAEQKLRIAEVPITYSARGGTPSKLRSFSDGWRHVRFMLMYSPNYLFMLPGGALFLSGAFLMLLLLPGSVVVKGVTLDINSMLLGSLLSILGFQILTMGFTIKTYAVAGSFQKEGSLTSFVSRHLSLERSITLGLLVTLFGILLGLKVFNEWYLSGFGALSEFRNIILASTFIIIGVQTVFSAFFLSILLVEKRNGN